MLGVRIQGEALRTFQTGLLVFIFLAQSIISVQMGWTQASKPLQNRIPKSDPKKYQAIQDANDWKNPFLVIRPEGVEIRGITPLGRGIPVDAVFGILEGLPDSAWPYGLIVAVSNVGVVSSSRDNIPLLNANR